MVDREAGGDGREPRLRGLDFRAIGDLAMEPEKRLLDDVLSLADGADHVIGDREQQWAQRGVDVLKLAGPSTRSTVVHPSSMTVLPSRP